MMGSHDALRLVKGMLVEDGRLEIVREGLNERAGELRADLETLKTVRDLIVQAGTGDEAQVGELDSILSQWEEFCDFIEGPWEPTLDSLREMLKFAAIRALALRDMAVFPGGHAALANFARVGSSFRFRGRRMAPPRCLFHSKAHGCLAGRWKPAKCANFFCTEEPNVLRSLREELSFDEFVLGNAEVVTPSQAVGIVRRELELGFEFVEPKIFIGLADDHSRQIGALLETTYGSLFQPAVHRGRFMQSVAEWEHTLENVDEQRPCLVDCDSVDGSALYELAIALDMRRAEGQAVPFVLVATDLADSGPFPHPLWSDQQISQPLGILDLYVVDD